MTTPAPIQITNIKITSIQNRKWEDGSDFNPRSDIGCVERLQETIKDHGLLAPITVAPTGKKGKYYLVCGARRLTACKNLKYISIPVVVRADAEDIWVAFDIAMVENSEDSRTIPNPVDLARAFLRYKDQGLSAPKIAERTGHHAQQVRRYMALVEDLPADITAKVEEGSLTVHAAVEMSRLSEAVQESITSKVTSTTTALDIRKLASDEIDKRNDAEDADADASEWEEEEEGEGQVDVPQTPRPTRQQPLAVWCSKSEQAEVLHSLGRVLCHILDGDEDYYTDEFLVTLGTAWGLAWVRGLVRNPFAPAYTGAQVKKTNRPDVDLTLITVYDSDGDVVERPSNIARKEAEASTLRDHKAFWTYLESVR